MNEAKEYFGNWSEVIPFKELEECLGALKPQDIQSNLIMPSPEKVFKAFIKCDYNKLKVVILGEDPYPQLNVATGLAFGNDNKTRYENWSPSLKVLFNSLVKECTDLPMDESPFPSLQNWAQQGVLLLNSALTVKTNNPGSHILLWNKFIVKLLKNIADKKPDVVFVLLGSTAKSYKAYVEKCVVFEANHPAYYARTNTEFPGKIFSDVNKELSKTAKSVIEWL